MHVCVGGSFIRGTSSGQLVIFVVNSCSRLLSLASRVNKQTVNLAGCLNIVGSVMFLKVKLYLTTCRLPILQYQIKNKQYLFKAIHSTITRLWQCKGNSQIQNWTSDLHLYIQGIWTLLTSFFSLFLKCFVQYMTLLSGMITYRHTTTEAVLIKCSFVFWE